MRTIKEIKDDFVVVLKKWQDIVDEHSLNVLQKKPEPIQWSLGQVVDHIIDVTDWYFLQARKALADTQNIQKPKSTTITEWFTVNSFPDERFNGPEDACEPSQPTSKTELVDQLERLKNDVMNIADTLSKSTSPGKSKHPGHQYLTANEWFQFAEMHCRHHFRQIERIGDILGI